MRNWGSLSWEEKELFIRIKDRKHLFEPQEKFELDECLMTEMQMRPITVEEIKAAHERVDFVEEVYLAKKAY